VVNAQQIHKTPDLNAPHLSEGVLRKIDASDVDTDADYWLLTDADVSITDMWRTARILFGMFHEVLFICHLLKLTKHLEFLI